jgi:protein tyrosine/serine phosphatase
MAIGESNERLQFTKQFITNEQKGDGFTDTSMTERLKRAALRASLLAISINLIASAPAIAKSKKSRDSSSIQIKNFGQMDDRFFRGAQPKEGDYAALAALGIKTIIDLQDDPTSYEKRDAEAAGMRYVNIPMSDSSRPQERQIEQFLKLVNDPATGRFFVHCAGGRHRTGVMGAVYRMNHDGWDFDRAYSEMKQYDFYTRWGHGSLKDYVQDYYGNLKSIEVSAGHSSGVNR